MKIFIVEDDQKLAIDFTINSAAGLGTTVTFGIQKPK